METKFALYMIWFFWAGPWIGILHCILSLPWMVLWSLNSGECNILSYWYLISELLIVFVCLLLVFLYFFLLLECFIIFCLLFHRCVDAVSMRTYIFSLFFNPISISYQSLYNAFTLFLRTWKWNAFSSFLRYSLKKGYLTLCKKRHRLWEAILTTVPYWRYRYYGVILPVEALQVSYYYFLWSSDNESSGHRFKWLQF